MKDYDLGQIQSSSASGIDALFEREPQLVTAKMPKKVRVASLAASSGSTASARTRSSTRVTVTCGPSRRRAMASSTSSASSTTTVRH